VYVKHIIGQISFLCILLEDSSGNTSTTHITIQLKFLFILLEISSSNTYMWRITLVNKCSCETCWKLAMLIRECDAYHLSTGVLMHLAGN